MIRIYIIQEHNCHRCGLPLVRANPAAEHPFSEEDEQIDFCAGCGCASMTRRLYPKQAKLNEEVKE